MGTLSILGLCTSSKTKPDASNSYIKDGLIFLIDGYDSNKGDGFLYDLIQNIQFRPELVSIKDGYFEIAGFLTGGAVLISKTNIDAPCDTCTIECCYEFGLDDEGELTLNSGYIVVAKNTNINFGFKSAGIAISGDSLNKRNAFKPIQSKVLTTSANINTAITNGIALEKSSTSTYVGGNNDKNITLMANYLGLSNLWGKLYAVRIYNRHLTPEEMRHNLRIDQEKYNLNITIADE